MQHNDLVTVVTVTYNAEDMLEKTILSVINQSYENIEYIIIDGASTDKTVDIIKQYEGKIGYWVSEPDEGIYFAMNKAIEKATGKWLNFMNAGDSFANDTTVELVMGKVDNNTELIYGDHITNGVVYNVKEQQIITRSIPCCHQSLFVNTILMKDNPFNPFYTISADYDFILKMYKEGREFKYIEEPLSHYDGGGISVQNMLQQKLESLTVLMNNNIEFNEVISSRPYKYIQNIGIKKRDLQLKELKNLIKELSSIRGILHPFKKYKAYKKLLRGSQKIWL